MTTNEMITFEQMVEYGLYTSESLARYLNYYRLFGYNAKIALQNALYEKTGFWDMVEYINCEG